MEPVAMAGPVCGCGCQGRGVKEEAVRVRSKALNQVQDAILSSWVGEQLSVAALRVRLERARGLQAAAQLRRPKRTVASSNSGDAKDYKEANAAQAGDWGLAAQRSTVALLPRSQRRAHPGVGAPIQPRMRLLWVPQPAAGVAY